MPLNPGKEPLHKPTPFIAAQTAAVLGFAFLPVRAVWRDHLDAIFPEFLVQFVTVIRTVADQVLGRGFYHVEVKAELHQSDLMVIRRVRTDRLGIKPIYYFWGGKTFAFCSEIKEIANLVKTALRLNPLALAFYSTLGYVSN